MNFGIEIRLHTGGPKRAGSQTTNTASERPSTPTRRPPRLLVPPVPPRRRRRHRPRRQTPRSLASLRTTTSGTPCSVRSPPPSRILTNQLLHSRRLVCPNHQHSAPPRRRLLRMEPRCGGRLHVGAMGGIRLLHRHLERHPNTNTNNSTDALAHAGPQHRVQLHCVRARAARRALCPVCGAPRGESGGLVYVECGAGMAGCGVWEYVLEGYYYCVGVGGA